MTKALAIIAIAIFAVLNLAGWWWFNRPVPVELSFSEPFPSVSFAPFRRGQGPIIKVFPSSEQVVEDLKSLVGVTRGVHTYTSLEGMDIVPEAAGKLGIEVTHSAWLGQKADNNDMEVEALIKAANHHPDTITWVIVGNEVLLRQDLTADQLVGYPPGQIPGEAASFLCRWEDEPVGVDGAAEHIVKIYRMKKLCALAHSMRFQSRPCLARRTHPTTRPATPGVLGATGKN